MEDILYKLQLIFCLLIERVHEITQMEFQLISKCTLSGIDFPESFRIIVEMHI